MRCENCKHWADKAWDEGELIRIVDSAGRAGCIAISTIREREDENPDERAVVAAYGMGDCLLRTRGDFGCVLFEPKSPALEGAQCRIDSKASYLVTPERADELFRWLEDQSRVRVRGKEGFLVDVAIEQSPQTRDLMKVNELLFVAMDGSGPVLCAPKEVSLA